MLVGVAIVADVAFQNLPLEVLGSEVGLRVVRQGGELIEELLAKGADGKFHVILVSPSHSSVRAKGEIVQTAVQGVGSGLFRQAPSFAFQKVERRVSGSNTLVTLSRTEDGLVLKKTLAIPKTGPNIHIEAIAEFTRLPARIESFLVSYAFAPKGKPGKPDTTFAPGFRPQANQVIGDHFFRAPLVMAQQGGLAASLLPDLDVLADNRPIPTIIDLDCRNGVTSAPLLSYGFAEHKLSGHVYYTHDPSMTRTVPRELRLAMDLRLSAKAEAHAGYRESAAYLWRRYGHKNFDRVLPQAMPFEEYAKVCYPAAFAEQYGTNKLGWFEQEIGGHICGGVPAGWGFERGWVSWQCWFNNLRSAWGLRWWGKKLGNADWVDKADKMLNLALAAPMDRGAVPTTYQSREKQWKGTLISPDPKCYYDLTNMAWKGIWMLRWLEFADCPRREEILQQCKEMADLMVRMQNKDGSIPTWLDKDLKVVPVLDHSAQTALPAWFLAEYALVAKPELMKEMQLLMNIKGDVTPEVRRQIAALSAKTKALGTLAEAQGKACDFLVREVIDGQYYYDFETFFSCSPKQCFQRDGKVDHEAMRDHHTLQAPQNTLCMQWSAEALAAANKIQDLRPTVTGAVKETAISAILHRVVPGPSEEYSKAALKALDIMALYQNVWSLPYRKAAYTFGGFGVQNSDGEYLDARQAQFGATLCDFGAALGRADYFERGVAATRAAMTLINHPLHEQLGLYPNPNYPLGLQPENVAHGGWDHQAGRTGFDWGEGSGLASMAWLLHKYEASYKIGNSTIIVDGGWKGKEWAEAHPPKPLVDPTFDFSDWRTLELWTIEGNIAEVPTWSTRMDFGVKPGTAFIGTCEDGRGGYDDGYTGALTSPAFKVTKPRMHLMVGGGSGKDVYVELIDSEGKQLRVARGRNSERMSEAVWDLAGLAGKDLRIRIVDRETGGWGHINVGPIHCM